MSSNKMRYISIIAIFGLFSCDIVQKSLRKKEAIDAAIANYVARNPPKRDTVYKEGAERVRYDTIVNENIYVDTIRIRDTAFIRKVKYQDIIKTVMKTDTMYQVIVDDKDVSWLRQNLDRTLGQLDAKSRTARNLLWAVILLGIALIASLLIRLFIR